MVSPQHEDDKRQASKRQNDGRQNDRPEDGINWLKYAGMAIQMAVTILVFVFGGISLDEWLGTAPWLTVVLSLAGVAAGLYVSLKDFL